jgi:phosphohistidine phosphatase
LDVYFLRHGLADWPDWDPAHDDERPLTSNGVVRMKAEAKRFEQLGLKFDVILTSPFKRARQSAEIVARRLGGELVEDPALAPGFNETVVAAIVGRYPAAKAILLIGHEPDFSATISALIGGARIKLKRGGLARVETAWRESGDLSGTLVWLLPPKWLTVDG